MINEYFNNGITFNQETTLCGNNIIKILKKPKCLVIMWNFIMLGECKYKKNAQLIEYL